MKQAAAGNQLSDQGQNLQRVSHWLHANFIWLLVASYAAAAVSPEAGLALRSIHIGGPSLPAILLATLLFNAGIGFRLSALNAWKTQVKPLLIGTVGNLLLSVLMLAATSKLLGLWHNPDEAQNIVVGLALVASMPIAGSSTAWAQNAAGDVALSLCLVIFSTMVSPAATPLLLHFAGFFTAGDYSEDLHELARNGTSDFLLLYVLVPSLLGMLAAFLLGQVRLTAIRPVLRIVNSIVLLILCYSNAATSLPKAMATPDWDFLLLTLAITVVFCLVFFFGGLVASRKLQVARAQQVSLTFGLGMSNNGTGLVIAASALPDHPLVLLPMLLYNLVQHLVAGFVDRKYFAGRD